DRRRATSARSVTSEKGKIKERLGTPSRTQLSRCRQTTMNLVPTQDGEHLEQSRTYCFSRDRYTDRVNQCSRLHTARLGRGAQRGLGRRLIEMLHPRKCRVDGRQMLPHPADTQMLVDRGGVVLDRVGEKKPPVSDQIVEPLRARLQQ